MKQGTLKTVAGTLIALIILSGNTVLAQDRDRDRATDQDRAADQDRVQDRDQDRIADTDRLQDRDRDRLTDRDQLQDRDQLHVQDRDQLRGRDIYGSELMTRHERREYQSRIRNAETVQQWARYRAEHQARMMARATEEGVDLPAPFYGQQLMTDRERAQLRQRLSDASSDQDRERIRAEHREEMQERARENQIPLAELE